jgi:UDP-N-acetylmuramyl pentapeptide phosphotransferase/UDP-N-acetylglucosamine-1-phosphate transferase
MLIIFVAFITALLVTLLIIHSSAKHAHLSNDHDFSGPQKFHAKAVPRIGGMGILAGVGAGTAVLHFIHPELSASFVVLLLCALPAFVGGVAEDVTKNVSPSRRLLFTAAAAALAFWFVGAALNRTGLAPFDALLGFAGFSAVVTIFVVVGVTNSVNIIDGFNGLASMCVILMLAATAFVAFQVGDMVIFEASLLLMGAVAGFFVWNFPMGLIFLGDGGAYFLGFMVSELLIMLLHRNPAVSPMFPLVICIYPVVETVFSIYRKKFIRKMSPGVPDGVHLHMLVYKRLMRWAVGNRDARALTHRNSMTSPYLWVLCMSSVIPGLLFWNNTPVLLGVIAVFAALYVMLYWRIVRFRSPRWMVTRR